MGPSKDIYERVNDAQLAEGIPDRGLSELAEAIERIEWWMRFAWPGHVKFNGEFVPGQETPLLLALRTVIEVARTQLTEPEPVYPYLAAPSGAAHEGSEE